MNNVIDLAAERRARDRRRRGRPAAEAAISGDARDPGTGASTAETAKSHDLVEVAAALGLPSDSLL